MMVLRTLRAIAVAMAGIAVVDPAFSTTRLVPAPVDLVVDPYASSSDELRAIADDVQARLRRRLGSDVVFNGDRDAAARVLIGNRSIALDRGADVPTSTVLLDAVSAPNVLVAAVDPPAIVPEGWTVNVHATLEARGLAGATSQIVLEHEGIEVAVVERKWTGELDRANVTLPYTPPGEGVAKLTLRARPISGEARVSDNAVDIALTTIARRLNVLAYEPRPSWGAAFVRRALEDHASFEVSTMVRSSARITVRTGMPPATLSSSALHAYDAVIVGAPEELTTTEIGALETFMRVRGGTVVLLPDRRPSGRRANLVAKTEFEEVLVERPLELVTRVGRKLRASEIVVPRQEMPHADVVASVELKDGARPVIFSQPLGSGTVIFSGALDAWRNRDAADDGFARFWQTTIADAALRAPSRIEVDVEPAIARPGADAIVRARLRRTEIQEAGDRTIMPSINARLIGTRGTEEPIRLWPSVEPGVFEGRIRVPPPGRYDVQVTAGSATADALLLSASDARPLPELDDAGRSSMLLASATGGVVASPDDLGPLERHLRGLPKPSSDAVRRPARSMWFMLSFAALLSAEWMLRRRRGLA